MSDVKLMSTSALSKKLCIPKVKLDELLLAASYIERLDDGFTLSKKGEELGGSYLTHAKFGKYIAWPEDLVLPDKTISQGQEYLNATSLGNKYNISARKINMMLSEIGWIERYLKGWTITNLGMKNGGLQHENTKNGIPFVEWPVSILDNAALKEVVKEVQGDAGQERQSQINSNNESFRGKFEAQHRATDGHMVRSKAEMLIDNWLYMAEIVHAYERKLPIEEEVYCDFYIPTGKVYIEFWGLENDPKYAERKKVKKAIYEKYGFKLIELVDEDVFNLDDVLPRMLLKFGVQTY